MASCLCPIGWGHHLNRDKHSSTQFLEVREWLRGITSTDPSTQQHTMLLDQLLSEIWSDKLKHPVLELMPAVGMAADRLSGSGLVSAAGKTAEAAACVYVIPGTDPDSQHRSCTSCALTVLQVLHNAKEQWTEGNSAQTTSAATGSHGAEKKSVVEQVREGVASVTQNAQGGSNFVQHVQTSG